MEAVWSEIIIRDVTGGPSAGFAAVDNWPTRRGTWNPSLYREQRQRLSTATGRGGDRENVDFHGGLGGILRIVASEEKAVGRVALNGSAPKVTEKWGRHKNESLVNFQLKKCFP